ncbi:hypothetical protein QR680_002143 [Steinernema hermaphroditum]|uniref:Uncharacterized protein n=1 Tax=Steinernema hermaphroditum TaxID=289476 RepID=A0AA39LH42_9BILA|nr:hypothetical protein QR680_002143 [Steinernema hermaphroditum]
MLLLAHDGTCTAVELTTFFGSEEGNDFFAPALFIALLFLLITQWTAASYFFIGFTFEPIPKGCTRKLNSLKNQFVTCDDPKCGSCRHKRTVRGAESSP